MTGDARCYFLMTKKVTKEVLPPSCAVSKAPLRHSLNQNRL